MANPYPLKGNDDTGDNALMVTFRKEAVKNEFLSEKESRPIFQDIVVVHVQIPGRKDLSMVTEVTEDHKRRFPVQWAAFQNDGVNAMCVVGTPLDQWGITTPAVVAELKAMGFHTVDSIANANDSVIKNIGMKVGMTPETFREKAKEYLSGGTVPNDQAKKIQELQTQVERLMKLLENQPTIAPQPLGRRPVAVKAE